ncbi:MAG TPA: translation initiation factor IF-2 [bacterium]|nr:translation initiation factor IF-2 [bacterium]
MRISEIAKDLGRSSKELMEFLNEQGASYKNAANGITPEEESLLRKTFGVASSAKSTAAVLKTTGKSTEKAAKTAKEPEAPKKTAVILKKKEPEPEPEQPKAVVAVVRSKSQRSYVPEERRAEIAEKQAEEVVAVQETPPAPVDAPVPSATPVEGTADALPKPAEPQATVLEEMLLKPSFRIESPTEERVITPETPQQNEMRRPAAAPVEEDKGDHKHKKRKVVIPEAEEERPAAAKKFVHPRPGDKKKKVDEQVKVKAKLRGVDISVLKTEEEDAADRRAGLKKKSARRLPPPPMQAPNPTKAIKKIIRIENTVVVSEFARRMGIKVGDVIRKLMSLGELSGINDRVNFDTATLIANEFGFQVENVAMNETSFVDMHEDTAEELVTRPPVVTVMGHVDHGKTKLLDAIRNTNVVDKEAGGITQHIGAYTVELEKGKITFLDTPGHEAFTAMRSRGAQATDLVILIVAADDGVMPQTIEAINHAKAANVPIIVAVNKIDKPEANPEKVRQELLKYEIVPEEWGGTNLFVEISAKQRINIDKLLESILLQVEMMELKANPNKPAVGVVIESRMDPGRGPVATALVKEGTLKIGDLVATATAFGYVRSMTDWRGVRVKEAGPSMAVEITGLDSVPPAGEMIHTFTDEKKARGYVDLRKNKIKEQKYEKEEKVTLDNLFAKIEGGDVKDFNLVIKGDVDGSVEAIIGSLRKIEHEKLKIRVIHSGVGGITENDVLLASASKAVLFGFNVRIDNKAKQTASAEHVDIRIFSIIYDLIDAIKAAMSGKLAPIMKEEYVGAAEVRQVFRITKVGNIAGCMVTDGRIVRKGRVKLIRNNVVLYDGLLSSLKHFKDDAKEVKAGFECGLSIENYNDIKEGDLVECYIDTQVADEVL